LESIGKACLSFILGQSSLPLSKSKTEKRPINRKTKRKAMFFAPNPPQSYSVSLFQRRNFLFQVTPTSALQPALCWINLEKTKKKVGQASFIPTASSGRSLPEKKSGT